MAGTPAVWELANQQGAAVSGGLGPSGPILVAPG